MAQEPFPYVDLDVDRNVELRIKGHLYEIEEVNDKVIESQQGLPASRAGYTRTLESVARVANAELVDEVAEYIKDFIQDQESRPENQDVRIEARRKVSQAGYPPDPYLNSA